MPMWTCKPTRWIGWYLIGFINWFFFNGNLWCVPLNGMNTEKVMVGLSHVQVQLEPVLHHFQLRERDLLVWMRFSIFMICKFRSQTVVRGKLQYFIHYSACLLPSSAWRTSSFHQWSDHDLSSPPHPHRHHGSCGYCSVTHHHIHENARQKGWCGSQTTVAYMVCTYYHTTLMVYRFSTLTVMVRKLANKKTRKRLVGVNPNWKAIKLRVYIVWLKNFLCLKSADIDKDFRVSCPNSVLVNSWSISGTWFELMWVRSYDLNSTNASDPIRLQQRLV